MNEAGRRHRPAARLILILAATVGLAACARGMKQMGPADFEPQVRWVKDEISTRAAMALSFGPPDVAFEKDRVEIWYLSKQQRPVQQDRMRSPKQRLEAIRYHLVVAYDEWGVIVRRSLLRVR